ncbi:serine/threonine-protein phosphatase 1 regulatory subunit 10 [Drosophila simulans]|uniref:GD22177 n=1 Tax=Drosophila simulans TaxID=7240 RepID=B4QAD8_DROSI|nr:serine/threonine-protein phosphatase 1 regulatory subunit 10 [Drosophila simulans]EDX04693.1 GD22177 [Drosophila simulans]KMY89751.1 uncharacterized protein Dsimw501_GD22177 [Drosophila simulans]
MENGPEFNWEYSHGGPGNPNYSQMGRGSTPPGGGGRQWLHSSQANTNNYGHGSSGMGSHQNNPSPGDPFASYNQNMMNMYTNFKPSYGHSQVGPASVQGMGPEPGQEMGNRMGNRMGHSMPESMGFDGGMGSGMDSGMGHGMGMSNGLGAGMRVGSMRGGQRLAGGYSSNGLNDPNPSLSHRGSWF